MRAEAGHFLCIEIGGTKLQLIVYAEKGEALGRWRMHVDAAKGAQGVLERVERALGEIREQFRLSAAGIGFGGPVDWKEGRICVSHQVSGWADFPLASWMQERAGIPVKLENDANAAALGEAVFGAGRGYRTVFYMNAGSGIGGGLVQDGKLYHGALPGEVEIGHLRMDAEGNTLESLCSGWAVDAQVRAAARTNPGSILARLCDRADRTAHEAGGNGDREGRAGGNGKQEARFLKPALEQGCPVAAQIMERVGRHMAWALSYAVHLFHPDVIVLGGGLSLLGEAYRGAISKALPDMVMQAFQPPPEIKLAALGEEVVPLGVLALIRQ